MLTDGYKCYISAKQMETKLFYGARAPGEGAIYKEGIFLIGTTNYPEKIDPALINHAG